MRNVKSKCDVCAKTMYCKELKLLYVIVVLLLEADLLVNIGAMESKRSSILVTQNPDDLKALELCTTRNQQRLGSVFGNFTRHHKKGIYYATCLYAYFILRIKLYVACELLDVTYKNSFLTLNSI